MYMLAAEKKFSFKSIFLLWGGGVIILLLCGWFSFLKNAGSESITVPEAGPAAAQRRAGPAGFAIYLFLQLRAADLNRPSANDPNPTPFTIEPGETAPAVAGKLQALKLINDPLLFRLFLRYNDLDTTLEAGNYELRGDMTPKEVGVALQKARIEEVEVTIPEGWRAEQIAEHLTSENIMDGGTFLVVVREGRGVNHPLLAGHPAGQSYEGYLFPDTYRLPLDAGPEELIITMLDNLAAKLPVNTASLAEQQGLTFHQILTIAAIVEREAVVPEERPLIAGVYLNRLGPKSPRNYLESDSTVQYAMGYQPETKQWWKTPVTLDEFFAVHSPYNTYLNPGLPPGPIANPGIASIIAVLQPAETDYLFFVCARPACEGGNHVFAKTYEEHLQNVANYYGE